MIRSMFTAINALHTQQTFMDVVADNLANVNTPGFKSSFITFQDQFAQLMSSGAAPTDTLGGVNPVQVGMGLNLGTVAMSFTQGALQSTGRDLDLAIQGDGFFVYSDNVRTYYSREGSIAIDSRGFLVNSGTGNRLMGWQADASGTVDTGGPLVGLQIPIDSTVARTTENAYLLGNLDSTTPVPTAAAYFVTMGVYDSLGDLHSVTLQFDRTGANEWSWQVSSGALDGSGTVTYDANGQFVSSTTIDPITVPGSDGSANFDVEVDLSGTTMLADPSTIALASQDGLNAGTLIGFNVTANTGEIYGVYTNGDQRLIGQTAMALFVNPAGLIRMGNNRYVPGLNSGEARIGAGGSGGRGKISSGYVEGSNVDMGREFSNMILAQRGFQASTRIITTSDEMLQELVNLRR